MTEIKKITLNSTTKEILFKITSYFLTFSNVKNENVKSNSVKFLFSVLRNQEKYNVILFNE